MEEKKEILTTKTYTLSDMVALLGEGKQTVRISISLAHRDGPVRWYNISGAGDQNLLRIEIYEPFEKVDKK